MREGAMLVGWAEPGNPGDSVCVFACLWVGKRVTGKPQRMRRLSKATASFRVFPFCLGTSLHWRETLTGRCSC